MDESVIEKIALEYDELSERKIKERDKRVASVYEKFPEIRAVDEEINNIGSSTLQKILKDPLDKSARSEMDNKFKVLKQKRKELLGKYDIPEDFDKPKYDCSICKDTGFVEGVGRCSCFRQKIIDELYRASNMKELLKRQNFDVFDMELYGKNKVSGFKRSPYDNMVFIKKHCMDFADNFDKPAKNMIFYGDTGLGKTFMSCCVAKRVMDKGYTVLYISAQRLFRTLDDERFGRAGERAKEIYGCDLLIIDDLGTEISSKNNPSYLFDLVNERYNAEKKIIINTNLNFEGLEKLYTARFTSRIMENFEMMLFYGEDIRKKKMFGN